MHLLAGGDRIVLDVAEKADGDLRSDLVTVLDGRTIEGLNEDTLGHVVLLEEVDDVVHFIVGVRALDLKEEVTATSLEILKLLSEGWQASSSEDGMEPGTSIKSLQLIIGEITDVTLTVGGTINGGIVENEGDVILAGLSIVLNPLSTSTTSDLLGDDGVLRAGRRHTTVADDDEGIVLEGTDTEVVGGELLTNAVDEIAVDTLGLYASLTVAVSANPEEGAEAHGSDVAHHSVPGSLIISALGALDIIGNTSLLSDREPRGKRSVINSLNETDRKAGFLGDLDTHAQASVVGVITDGHPTHLGVKSLLSNANSVNVRGSVANRARHLLTSADKHIAEKNTVEGLLTNTQLLRSVRGSNRCKTSNPFTLSISPGLSNENTIQEDGDTGIWCNILTKKNSAVRSCLKNHIVSKNIAENTLARRGTYNREYK